MEVNDKSGINSPGKPSFIQDPKEEKSGLLGIMLLKLSAYSLQYPLIKGMGGLIQMVDACESFSS